VQVTVMHMTALYHNVVNAISGGSRILEQRGGRVEVWGRKFSKILCKK